jgi:hypothetical protein
MNKIPTAKEAITQARNEVAKEKFDVAVKKLKTKLRELDAAQVVVDNIEREIADLEQAIEQGNA